jgi:hypothetical protein
MGVKIMSKRTQFCHVMKGCRLLCKNRSKDDLWMCGKPNTHHHTEYKLYLRTCGKPTDITSPGTNCTCGCAENPQTSPHRAQNVTLAVRKTHRPSQRVQTVPLAVRKTHRPSQWVQTVPVHVRKARDITILGTDCTCEGAETPGHHHTEHKLYLWMCGKPTDITTQRTNCTCGCGGALVSLGWDRRDWWLAVLLVREAF